MPKYIYKVQTDNITMPADGWLKFGAATFNAASLTAIGTISGKLTATKAASIAAVASANAGATYTAAEQTLINELKTQVNALIAGQKTAGQML